MPKQELEVKAAWHAQVHRSKVAALALESGGAALWCGCNAAAPRARPLASGAEPPVALVDCSTGATLRVAQGAPACNVRLLLPGPGAGEVLAASGDGRLFGLSGEACSVAATAALPGTPAAAAEAAGGDGTQEQAAQAASGAEAAAAMQVEAAPSSGAGPEFIAEAGYRGHKEGYLFREGALGGGYYRKDVVRRHCASAAAPAPAPAPATPPAAAAPTASKHAPAPPAAAQQQGTEQQEEACGAEPTAAAASGKEEGELSGEEARRYIQSLLAAPPSMHSVVVDQRRGLLCTASLGPKDCGIRVWRLHGDADASSGSGDDGAPSPPLLAPQLHRTLTGHASPVLSLALSPDGSLLYSGSHDCTVRVWSTADWHCRRTLKGHGGGVRALAAAPDGSALYTAAADNTIRAWSTQHWVCLRTLHGRHEDTTWPACLALSPDGSLLASGSTGPFGASTLKLFCTGTGGGHEAGACLASVAQLGYHQKGGLSALAFAGDGATLYSGASDGTVAAWSLAWREAPASSRAGFRRGFL